MPLTPTTNLKKYAADLDLLADKPGNLVELIEELQAANANVEALTENFNALLAKLDEDTGVNNDDYEATLVVGEDEE